MVHIIRAAFLEPNHSSIFYRHHNRSMAMVSQKTPSLVVRGTKRKTGDSNKIQSIRKSCLISCPAPCCLENCPINLVQDIYPCTQWGKDNTALSPLYHYRLPRVRRNCLSPCPHSLDKFRQESSAPPQLPLLGSKQPGVRCAIQQAG